MRKTLSLFVAIWIAGSLFAADALKIAQSPKLDGKLDESFWKDAKPLGDFQIWDGPQKGKATSDTDVRLVYDDTWLYVGVKRENPFQKLILGPKVKGHDGAVNQDESLELFISPDAKGKVYYHFILSCFNVKAEQRFIAGKRERESWNLPWRSATAISDTGWTAELAIPLYLFLEYGDLDHLRLNIARNQRQPFLDNCKVITYETIERAIWLPVARSFHETEAFGAISPLKPDKLQIPFLASLEGLNVQPYFIKNGENYYRVDLELRGATTRSGDVEVVVIDQTVNGKKAIVKKRVTRNGTGLTRLSVEVPAPTPEERSVTVETRDAQTGDLFQSTVIDNPACLNVMSAYLDRNYYTSENESVAIAEIALPAASLHGMTVTVTVNGKTVASAPAAVETQIPFSIKNMSEGTCPVSVTLRRQDGAPFFSVVTELTKRKPKPGREWKIDQINRVVLNNGAPFFPFGPVMGSVKPEDETDFKTIADAGCNTFFQWHWYLASEKASRYLEQAKKHGLYVVSLLETGWPSPRDVNLESPKKLLSADEAKELLSMWQVGSVHIRCFLMFSAAPVLARTAIFGEYFDKCAPFTEKMVRSVMDADNLVAYNSFDEPCDNTFFHITQYLDATYRLARGVDGYHPVMLLYSSHIPEGDEYLAGADILCTDPYWIPAGDASKEGRNTPNFISKIVTWNDRRAEKFRKAIWNIPMGWRWSGCRKRAISAEEQDCQNFLAIIHGAKGLFWFVYPMPDIGWENLKKAIAKVKVIGPMAIQPKVAQSVQYLRAEKPGAELKDAPFVPEREEFPDVQGRIFRDPKGGFVLLAANSRYYPVTATFAIKGLSGEVKNLFGETARKVEAGAFTEKLEPFAVRAYRLGDRLAEPMELVLAATRPERIPPPETSYPNNCRPGKKNVFPNPSFEEETIVDAPDYYFGVGMTVVEEKGVAKFGEKCLKLTHNKKSGGYAQVAWKCGPSREKDTAYIWSFWAKGVKGGEKLWVEGKTFPLTAEWKRYAFPLTIPARAGERAFDIRLSLGEVFLDGVQLEPGYRTTDFEE